MDINEYKAVRSLSYLEYCDYLQKKYGIGRADYMTAGFNQNRKVTRTGEGLWVHHKMENKAQKLSSKEEAMNNPFDWQKAHNLVYADYLEHLLLHIKICESLANPRDAFRLGMPGILTYLIPELNDLYSGFNTSQVWRAKCFSIVSNDKDVYLEIIKEFIEWAKKAIRLPLRELKISAAEGYNWNAANNEPLYREIEKIYKSI